MSSPRQRLVDVMVELVAEHGLDRLTVREVAGRAAVSIGAVQHHFATKDAMLAAAFAELVTRTRARLAQLTWGSDVRANVVAALGELLPLDATRAAEARMHLAFAARAAVTPSLAEIQAQVLADVVGELAEALRDYRPALTAPARRQRASVLLAATDGLSLHAVSSGEPVDTRMLAGALRAAVDAVLP